MREDVVVGCFVLSEVEMFGGMFGAFSLTVVVNLQVVEDVVVGGPAGASGEEHLPAFEG